MLRVNWFGNYCSFNVFTIVNDQGLDPGDSLPFDTIKTIKIPNEVLKYVNNPTSHNVRSAFSQKLSDIGQICELTELTKLEIEHHSIKDIPIDIGNLKKLRELYLAHNDIKSIPVEIGELVNLQRLDLSYNEIRSLPAEIGNLKDLRALDLSDNQIGSVVVQIGDLEELRHLNLSNNDITSLNDGFSQLSDLETLRLYGNNIEIIPDEIKFLPKLKILDTDVPGASKSNTKSNTKSINVHKKRHKTNGGYRKKSIKHIRKNRRTTHNRKTRKYI